MNPLSDKDPNELAEDFFTKDEQQDQNDLMERFQAPVPFNEKISMTNDNLGVQSQKKDEKEEDEEDDLIDFKFDDALAEEEKKELEALNEKFNTDFKSLNDLKQAFKKEDNKEIEGGIDEDKRFVSFIEDLLQYSDKELVLHDKLSYEKNQKGVLTPERKAAIEEEVEDLLENKVLSYAADAVKSKISQAMSEKKKSIADYENGKKQSELDSQAAFKNKLQEGIAEIFKEANFLTIKPTKQDLVEIYQDIIKDKHINHLKENPKDAVEYALFRKYKEVLSKNLGKPNFNAGVQSALKELGMSNSESGKTAKDVSTDSNDGNLSYLEQFAK